MKKKLAAQGNSWTIYINKSWATFMGITPESYDVLIYFEGKTLCIEHKCTEKVARENAIVKRLIKRSSGYAFVVTQPFLDILKITPEKDFVNIELEDSILKIYS